MKKLKVLMMMAVLSTVLCACGSAGKTQLTEADLETMSDAELEALIEERAAELEASDGSQNQQGEANEEAVMETYECMPEMMEANLEDALIQIDKTILKDDKTMVLNDAITALQNSGVEYTFVVHGFYGAEDTELNEETSVMPGNPIWVEVQKNGNRYFSIYANNTSEELVKASDSSVVIDRFGIDDDRAYQNIYYAKGICADIEGYDYNSMKELFAEYTDIMEEKKQFINSSQGDERVMSTVVSFEIPIENSNGKKVYIEYQYYIDDSNGSCVGVYMHCNQYVF